MTLGDAELKGLCQLAVEAAVATGRYVAGTRPASIEQKNNDGSLAAQVVTEVDRESQRRILQRLAPSMEQHDLALLTEESPDDGSRLSKDYFWCIDPIDGTLHFVEGLAGYAVSIALVSREGVPCIGVVYDPVAQVAYHAIRGNGAFRNGVRWQLDGSEPALAPRIYTDRSELADPRFDALARSLNATPGADGGAVMNAIRCLENPPALYFKQSRGSARRGGCFWDFAATACLYRELGAWASDVRGAPLALNRAESVFLGHSGVLFASQSSLAQRFLDVNRDP